MFERFLLAIDDSAGSEVATAFTSAFAVRLSARVHVCHINEFMVGGRGLTLHTAEEAEQLVSGAVGQLRAAGITAGGSIRSASYRDVARCIVNTAVTRQADAIVLGSNRHRGLLSRLLSPNVRGRTTRLTSLPVLTAPAPLQLSGRTAVGVDELILAEIDRSVASSPG
jgi:nucleotide-binding universal stress UspA family protein